MERSLSWAAGAFLLAMWFATVAQADTITLKNGDVLHGKVGTIVQGSMSFNSPVLGDITIKLSDLKSYQTDEPASVRLKSGATISSPITQGTAAEVKTANGKTTPVAEIKDINPPGETWTGSVVANALLNRGNTNNEAIGFSSNATLRRDDPYYNDKFLLGADYNFGVTGRGQSKTTTVDNWDASAGYDRYFTDQFYGLAVFGYNHDRIANLDYRLTPGLGVGYQWGESPNFNFDTEAGVTYRFEQYSTSGIDQNIVMRFAYHIDYALNDKVSAFNDVEWLPAFYDPANYVLTADAGINAKVTKAFFTQFKVVYKRNDDPPADTLKDDLSFLLGVGWKF
jgi:putative salt-induced outer membrane protein YdiY